MTSLFFTLASAAAAATPHASLAIEADVASMPWYVQLVSATVTLGLVVTTLCMFFCIYRVLMGPHIADRALAVDTMGVNLIALVVLLSLKFQTLIFFDGILVLSLVGFAGGVAMAQYIGRPHLRKNNRDSAVNPTAVNPDNHSDTNTLNQGPSTQMPSTDTQ